jgi:hypothetical protein
VSVIQRLLRRRLVRASVRYIEVIAQVPDSGTGDDGDELAGRRYLSVMQNTIGMAGMLTP